MSAYFITSSGTDIGKTFVTSLLVRQLRDAGKNVFACKPVASGFDPESSEGSDAHVISEALGLEFNERSAEFISPWRFFVPLSPHMAARYEQREIDTNALVDWCARVKESADTVLIEGVGGVMVPLTDSYTVRDWMKALKLPVIMVVGSYLGSISHSLSAAEVLFSSGIALKAVIVSETEQSSVALADTVASLRQFLPLTTQILALPRLNAWQDAPDLLSLIA
jgi:dethiobiotin synthetase